MELEGAVSVVTGAASGIGRATAIALARQGSDVVLADIDEGTARSAAEEIEGHGRLALVIRCDVTDRAEVEQLVTRAIEWQGRVDVLIANAGVGCSGAPHEFTASEWEYLIAVNLWSAIWPMRTILPHMLSRDRGHLVFVTSGAGFEAWGDRAPYNVAKFGIVGLAEAVARYVKDTGVDVSLVVPGAVATAGWKIYVIANADAIGPDEVERRRAEQREHSAHWPRPETMANAIVEGIRDSRYAIVQHNPYQEDWLTDVLMRKATDMDAFVLGG